MSQSDSFRPVPRIRHSKREASLRIQQLHDVKVKEESVTIDDLLEMAQTKRKRSTGSKPGNNIYGNIGTAKCKRCRKLKSKCEYKTEAEPCTKCVKAGKSCGKKVLAKDGRENGNDSGSDTNGQPLSVVISNTESLSSSDASVSASFWSWNDNFFLKVLELVDTGVRTPEEIAAKLVKEIQHYRDEHPIVLFDDANDDEGNDDGEESDEEDYMSVVDADQDEGFAADELETEPPHPDNEDSTPPSLDGTIFDDFAHDMTQSMSPAPRSNSQTFAPFTQHSHFAPSPVSPIFNHNVPTDGGHSNSSFTSSPMGPMFPPNPLAMMNYNVSPTQMNYGPFGTLQQHTDSGFASLTNPPKLSHVQAPSTAMYSSDPLTTFPYGVNVNPPLAMQNTGAGFAQNYGMDPNHDQFPLPDWINY